jgi:Zn-dependent protease with chaperone function
MTTIEPVTRFPDLSAAAFAHPADRAAMAALRSIPMLETLIKKLTEFGYEKHYRQLFLGQSVRLGDDQLPRVWALHRQSAYVLDVEPLPRLYLTQRAEGNAMTFGTNEPVIMVSSGLVAYGDDEMRAVLAHELGHVLADHVGLLTTMGILRSILKGALRGQPLVALPLLASYHALLEWSRMAELTSDRAAAIATGDPMTVCRSLMRVAGGPVEGLNLDAFIRQATEYHEERDPFARFKRFGSEITATHPFPVRRVRELVDWVSSGDYDRIRAGDYVHRGAEPPPSEEFNVAVGHYRQRWSGLLDRAGTGVQDVFNRVSSWLGGTGGSGAGSGEGNAGTTGDGDAGSDGFEGAEPV